MNMLPRTLFFALLYAAFPVLAVGLSDTGQTSCYDDSGADAVAASNAASVARDAGSHPRQDCRFGRDPAAAVGALNKIGDGAKGFDYTKIANDGTSVGPNAPLGKAATDWACTKDNLTGLLWEVKSPSSTDLRYAGSTYTWYSTDGATNGGDAGSAGGATACNTVFAGGACNTQSFVSAVNLTALCAHIDWRLPTRRELLTLVYAGSLIPSIDTSYFPSPSASAYWTASPYGPDTTSAWFVDFADGYAGASDKTHLYSVRLVRGTPF